MGKSELKPMPSRIVLLEDNTISLEQLSGPEKEQWAESLCKRLSVKLSFHVEPWIQAADDPDAHTQ